MPVDPKTIFTYDLPPERIAQRPVHPYDAARMLVVRREAGALEVASFTDLPRFVRRGDLLIFNDSRVIAARFLGKFFDTGGAVELLLLKRLSPARAVCLAKPLKRFQPGMRLDFDRGLFATVESRTDDGRAIVAFGGAAEGAPLDALLECVGKMPIPPYIRRGMSDEEDRADYQSLFAKHSGSVAAPTASLHFTPALIAALENEGAKILTLTLHVGAPSFLPVWHVGQPGAAVQEPGAEEFVYSRRALNAVQKTRAAGGRVIAVGTTVVRALESIVAGPLGEEGEARETALFITPGYRFLAVDAIITNFHQPGTTHLLLVQAAMGPELLRKSYDKAITSGFRFLSYGDGMFIC
jgi:S-adenosylmethionine:tRNA ribosyltransferase-isomerase